jgi:peptidyl-prolyl cis-trans isomerase A (cyclophilin A)
MRNLVVSGSAVLSLVALFACGDDTGGGGGAGGSGTTGATGTTTASSTSDAASTSVASSTSGGDGGTGGLGTGGEDVGSGGFGGASPLLDCADTDLEEEDLGELDEDPEAGEFTMEEALDGLPEGDGPLRAVIDTDLGDITCELFPDIAPIGVANFVGLARGRRAFEDEDDHWIRGRRFYDGLIFHRIIEAFMIQGGDPLGTGYGGPGYEFDNEADNDESHIPGTLAYANAGADTNGSQFFIVAEDPQTHLDGGYTIFGRCEPIGLVDRISEVETDADDLPLDPVVMHRVHITRCAAD